MIARTKDEQMLQQYLPMIRKRAHRASHDLNVEYEEMEAQGLFIFTRALRDYNPAAASFSTYLWHSLRALWDFGKVENRGKAGATDVWNDLEEDDQGAWRGLTSLDFYRLSSHPVESFLDGAAAIEAQLMLSEDAQRLLTFILGREWENPDIPSIRVTLIGLQGWFRVTNGWSKAQVQRAWAELKTWWTCCLSRAEGAQFQFSVN